MPSTRVTRFADVRASRMPLRSQVDDSLAAQETALASGKAASEIAHRVAERISQVAGVDDIGASNEVTTSDRWAKGVRSYQVASAANTVECPVAVEDTAQDAYDAICMPGELRKGVIGLLSAARKFGIRM